MIGSNKANKELESGPPYRLQIPLMGRTAGCVALLFIALICLVCSCLISGFILTLFIDPENTPVWLSVILWILLLIPVQWLLYKFFSRKTKSESFKEAIVYEDRIELADKISEPEVFAYFKDVTQISVCRYDDSRLGYSFDLLDEERHFLDVDVAEFPNANKPFENTVIPMVLEHWDRQFDEGWEELIGTDSATSNRMGALFRYAVGIGFIFYPNFWGSIYDAFYYGSKFWERAAYCGEDFFVCSEGIFHDRDKDLELWEDLRIIKNDDVALVLESKKTGVGFKVPITGEYVLTFRYWIEKKLKTIQPAVSD